MGNSVSYLSVFPSSTTSQISPSLPSEADARCPADPLKRWNRTIDVSTRAVGKSDWNKVYKFTLVVATKIRRSVTNSGLTSSAPMFTSHNCVAELYSWWVCLPHPLRGCSGCLMQEIGQASAEARITNCWQTQCREECVACQLNFSFTINVHLAANPRETSDALLLFFF